jgi:hypothetical protein
LRRSRVLALVLPLTAGTAALGVSLLMGVPAERALAQALRERGVKTTATIFKVTSSGTKREGKTYWSQVEYDVKGRRYETSGPMKCADCALSVPAYGEKVLLVYLPESPERAMLAENVPQGGTGSLLGGLLLIAVSVMIAAGVLNVVHD